MNSNCPKPERISLNYHLFNHAKAPDDLRHLILDISRATKYISYAIQTSERGLSGGTNMSGDEQLKIDVLSNNIMEQHLCESNLVCCYSSEEQEELVSLTDDAEFGVVFDPLDGSSLVDANFAIGSIIGIFKGKDIIGRKPRDLVAALYVLYGPRTTLVYSTGNGVHNFLLNDVGEFILTRKNLKIAPKSEFFAPGNCRACLERPEYKKWLDDCIFSGKTLRYSGGMTPDLHHILSKGGGVFAYPAHSKYPAGKLRLLFECAPFAFIFAEADGDARTEYGDPILDVECGEIHQRSTIFIGSSDEVSRAIKIVSDHRNTN